MGIEAHFASFPGEDRKYNRNRLPNQDSHILKNRTLVM